MALASKDTVLFVEKIAYIFCRITVQEGSAELDLASAKDGNGLFLRSNMPVLLISTYLFRCFAVSGGAIMG
jgi:hypothetical protein